VASVLRQHKHTAEPGCQMGTDVEILRFKRRSSKDGVSFKGYQCGRKRADAAASCIDSVKSSRDLPCASSSERQ
jgi:hypothetical protein